MVDSPREVCSSVRGREYPKKVWWNGVVKDAIERKEAAWRKVLGVRDEVAKDRCMMVYKGEKEDKSRYKCEYETILEGDE